MKVSKTTRSDIEGICAIEFDRYEHKYTDNPSEKEVFKELLSKRLIIASDWMWVVRDSEGVQGALSAQPTNKDKSEFVSWEDSTDNGTLVSTYIEGGENLYVVNLDVSRKSTREGGQYMLMTALAAQFISRSKNMVYFESRMPGFYDYVDSNIGIKAWSKLDMGKKNGIALTYSKLTVSKNGKTVLKDRLLNFYKESGFKNGGVVSGAFKDEESLDYGVVFYAVNPIPKWLRVWPVNKAVALLLKIFSKNPKIIDLLIR